MWEDLGSAFVNPRISGVSLSSNDPPRSTHLLKRKVPGHWSWLEARLVNGSTVSFILSNGRPREVMSMNASDPDSSGYGSKLALRTLSAIQVDGECWPQEEVLRIASDSFWGFMVDDALRLSSVCSVLES